MDNKLYCILEDEDYAGGGITAIFSTYEKALEYYAKIECRSCCSKEIVTMKIDEPDYQSEVLIGKYGQ